MIDTEKKSSVSANIWIGLAISLVFCFTIFMAGVVLKISSNEASANANTIRLNQSYQAAIQASRQSKLDRIYVTAFCKRFNRDESLTMQASKDLDALELKYAPVFADNVSVLAYHLERHKIISDAYNKRKQEPACPKAMAKAISDAANPQPKKSPSPGSSPSFRFRNLINPWSRNK